MNSNPFNWSFRSQYLLGAVLCFGLIGYALYVQFGMLMMPCPLCILQRIAFAAMGVFFLAGAIHGPRSRGGRLGYSLLVLLAAASGTGVAARHVWLQSLPADEVPLCSSLGLEYLIEAQGMFAALATALTGSGECAKVDWTFLGFSMPAWTLVWFVGLAVAAVWAALKQRN